MNKFKPIMVSFNEKAYNYAEAVAKKKLELLDKASVWIHNQLDDTIKLKFNKICTDMVAYFEDLILEFYKDKNQLGLSPKKLIEAKEIDIAELHKIKFEYVKSDYKLSIPKKGILFNKNQILCEIIKGNFRTYILQILPKFLGDQDQYQCQHQGHSKLSLFHLHDSYHL